MVPYLNNTLHKCKAIFMSGTVRGVDGNALPGLKIEYLIDNEEGALPTDLDGFYMIPVPQGSCVTIAPVLGLGVTVSPTFYRICPARQDVIQLDFKLSPVVPEN